MRVIGDIVLLQIQRSALKTGEAPNRVYDPGPILTVDRLAVGPDGVLGLGPDRSWIVDIHHKGHPATKNPDGRHGISIGFTTHYDLMRERFGERIDLGCAGENIIVETDRRFALEDLKAGVVMLAPDGRELHLDVLDVAHPCRPFTGWALGRTVESDALKAHLQFLDGGTRGFRLGGTTAGFVSVGDRVAVM